MTATLDLAACERALANRAYRLIGVAGQHRAKLLREKNEPDIRLQRGNASAFSHTEGVVCGMIHALRTFGFSESAEQVEHSLDAMYGASASAPIPPSPTPGGGAR